MERLLIWSCAGLLLAGVTVIPVAEAQREESRRPRGVKAVLAAVDGEMNWGEERIAGRRSVERTVIRPGIERYFYCTPPGLRNFRPPNMVDGDSSKVEGVVVRRNGVSLLSKDAPVTSSDPNPLGDLSLVTDGDREGDDGYFVDLAPGRQWVQIDLGTPRELWLVWMWMYYKIPVIYKDVIIEVASQEDFSDGRIVFNNDHDNSSGLGAGTDKSWIETYRGFPVRLNGVSARYVRLSSNGRYMDDTNHWIEVEVYGR